MVTRPAYRLKWRAAWPAEVPPADHVDLLAGVGARLRHRGAIEHAGAEEGVEPRDNQAPVRDAGGDNHRTGARLAAVRQRQHVAAGPRAQPRDLPRVEEARAEDPGLLVGPLRELRSTDTAGKAKVVANQGARARLAAYRFSL